MRMRKDALDARDLDTALLLAQMPPFDPSAPARHIRLALNSDLLRIARLLDIDLSVACEQALGELVRNALWRRCVDQRAVCESAEPRRPDED